MNKLIKYSIIGGIGFILGRSYQLGEIFIQSLKFKKENRDIIV